MDTKEMKKLVSFVCAILMGVTMITLPIGAKRADKAVYYMPAEDQGVVLAPSLEGEPYFEYDGGGTREGIINQVGDTYYLFYDGAATHTGPCDQNDPERHMWRACLAKSTDLIHWEKLGPRLFCGYDFDPTSGSDVYKDFYSASSPWAYFNEDDNHWYLFYLGAEGAAPSGGDVGTPATYYSTLIAKAKTPGLEGIEGEYQQYNQIEGQEKSVILWEKPATVSPGSVIENPLWEGEGDTDHMRYMMFVTRGDQVWIARSNVLDAVHDWNKKADSDGWVLDKQILDVTKQTSPENATIFYDEYTGWYYLFTNQFSDDFTHTDCNIVYWTKDPNHWDPEHCAVVNDQKSSKDNWATGAIGMPSVVRVDKETVAIIYDAQEGSSITHVGRKLGLAYWKLPRLAEDGTPLDFEPQREVSGELVGEGDIYVNDNDPAIVYTGAFTHDQGSPENRMGDVHYTNAKGSMEYTFTGTGIKWIGEKVFNRGNAEVFIDGKSQGIISQYDVGILYQQLIWEIQGLHYGEHTIRIVNLSNYTCLDGFVICTVEDESETDVQSSESNTDPVEPGTKPIEPDTEPDPESAPDTDLEITSEVESVTEPESETFPASEVTSKEETLTGNSSGCKSSLSFGFVGVMLSTMAWGLATIKRKQF
jgi:hypothetical protein